MPETFDYTGARVATDVKETFGDTGGVQLTDTMILRWLNDGQRQVAQDADFVRSQAVAPLVAGVGVMSLTDLLAGQRLKQVEAITLSGRRLQLIPFPEYLDMLDDASVSATGTPTVGMLRADALTLYPVPDTTVAGALTIYFTQWPLDLADLSEPLSIPARYYVPLRDYVLSQAYQMNDDLDGHNVKLQQFVAGVQGQYERENLSPVEVYPIVPQDEDWS